MCKNCNSRCPKVFLGGLPSSITETDLRSFFTRYGEVVEVVIMYDQGSVQQSRLSSEFAFQCCNLLQLLNTQKKMYQFISICISIFNFEVFKMGFKWGLTVLLIRAPICKLKCQNTNRDPKWDC